MVLARKYVVISPFIGAPNKKNFRIEEEELPPLGDHEFLAEAIYLSVDPYQRMKLGDRFPCPMIGGQIARVTESKNSNYPVGTAVMGHFGWRTHTVVNPNNAQMSGQKPFMYALPDLGELPLSLALGVLGRVGNTAYFGLMDICRPQSGETVAVTGAAGAVGSHVGQIAKIQGCRVIGFAGSEEKCQWLVNELGFDAAANYKTANITEFLKKNAPDGIDCYFDNVGGVLSSQIISEMNEFGRIAVCGAISSYNEICKDNFKATIVQPFMVGKQLKMEGFLVNRFAERTMQGINQNLQWVKEKKIKYREHIYEGFDNAVDAFIGLFNGDNTGKTLVKVK